MIEDKNSKNQLPIEKQINIAFNILSYNQELIQFVENKAGNLMVINSIYIGTLIPFASKLKNSSNHQILGIFILGLVIFLTISKALSIISTHKKSSALENYENLGNEISLIYFRDINTMITANAYINEFKKVDAPNFLNSLLNSIYLNSEIAKDKYEKFNFALTLTKLATLLWIINMITFLVA